ncbi:MAG: hypothetical protein Q9208_007286 [Pyrenodesmia sp. 3 TL-2023]
MDQALHTWASRKPDDAYLGAKALHVKDLFYGRVRMCSNLANSYMITRPTLPKEEAAELTKEISAMLDERSSRLDELTSLLGEGWSRPDKSVSRLVAHAFLNATWAPVGWTEKLIIAALNGENLYTQEELDSNIRTEILIEDAFEDKIQKEILEKRKRVPRMRTTFEDKIARLDRCILDIGTKIEARRTMFEDQVARLDKSIVDMGCNMEATKAQEDPTNAQNLAAIQSIKTGVKSLGI